MPLRRAVAPLALAVTLISLPACARAWGTPPTPDDARAQLVFQGNTLWADVISGSAKAVSATGHVWLTLPGATFAADNVTATAEAPHTITGKIEAAKGQLAVTGVLPSKNPTRTLPIRMGADQIDFTVGRTGERTDPARSSFTGKRVMLTTCTAEDPHYQLVLKGAALAGDGRLTARRMGVQIGRFTILSVPHVATDISGAASTVALPTLKPGTSSIDGTYLEAHYNVPVLASPTTDLTLTGRLGTQRLGRGEATLTHHFALDGQADAGQVSLVGTLRANMGDLVLGPGGQQARVTVSRLPVLVASLAPRPLFGNSTFEIGASAGRYSEHPTGVVANRTQVWGAVHSPAVRLAGPLVLRAGAAAQGATYGTGDQHFVGMGQLTMETDVNNPDRYFCLSYTRRTEHGTTPFVFDTAQIRNELFGEVEVPVSRDKVWRLNLSSRYDLDRGTSRELRVAAIYQLDCLSYCVSYDQSDRSVGLGIMLNGFGTFRRSPGRLKFTP